MSLRKKKYAWECAVKYGVFAALIAVLLFPFLFMVSKSLMTVNDINAHEVRLFPRELTLENFAVFGEYAKYFANSFIVIAVSMAAMPLSSCLVAFPLARYKFKGSRFMFAFLLATAMIPGSVLLVPQYFLFVRLKLVNTLASQYIGTFFTGGGVTVFLIIQFMRGIPKELDDAARIDGANKFRVFYRIVLPLCLNILIYLGIGVAIGKWNDFTGPLVYLREDAKRTIAVAFYYHFGASGNAALMSNVTMAMAVCMTVFPAALFFIFQKQMIGAIKIGGVKE
jgi:multiple sugar transport system permease protein